MDYSKGLEYRETDGYALLAQLVEHGIRNAGVRCSSHLEGTTFFPKKIDYNQGLYFSIGKFKQTSTRWGAISQDFEGNRYRLEKLVK